MAASSRSHILALLTIASLLVPSIHISAFAQNLSALPDYKVESVTVHPAVPVPGDEMSISAVVHNVGTNRGTVRSRAQLWIDQDADGSWDRASTLDIVSGISVGATYNVGWGNTGIPRPIDWIPVAGTHKAKVCINVPSPDPEDYRSDANPSNDCQTITFTVTGNTPPPTSSSAATRSSAQQAGTPDFALQDLRFFQDQTGYAMTVVVKNLGTGTDQWAGVRLDIDGTRGVMTYGIKPLATNATDTATWSSSVLAPKNGWSPTPGTHRATACIDNENGNPVDANAGNNCKDLTFTITGSAPSSSVRSSSTPASSRSTVPSSQSAPSSTSRTPVSSSSNLPDLTVSDMNVAPNADGNKINAWATVKNLTGNAGASSLIFEFRQEGNSGWESIVPARDIPSLAAGQTAEGNWENQGRGMQGTYTFPDGMYEFRACANAWHVLAESNLDNDCHPPMRVIIGVSSRASSAPPSSASSVRSTPNEDCFSSPALQQYAAQRCLNHCSRTSGKCGVNSFSVGPACQGQGLFHSATWVCYDGTGGSTDGSAPSPSNGGSSRSSSMSSRTSRTSSVFSASSARSRFHFSQSSLVFPEPRSASSMGTIFSRSSRGRLFPPRSPSSSSSSSRSFQFSVPGSMHSLGALPDYYPSRIVVDPSPALPGGQLEVVTIIKNLGGRAQTNPAARLKIFPDAAGSAPVWTSPDQDIGVLSPTQYTTATWETGRELTWQLVSGSYRAEVCVILRSAVDGNAANDCASQTFVVSSASPSHSQSSAPHSSSSLPAPSSSSRSASSSTPYTTSPGDAPRSSASPSSASSVRSSSSSIVDTSLPNLVVTNLLVSPQSFAAGDAWGASATIQNLGGTASRDTDARLKIDIDADGRDILVMNLRNVIPALRTGRGFDILWSTRTPGSIDWTAVPGRHKIGICVNDDHRAPEWNFDDNCQWSTIVIRAAGTPSPYTTSPGDVPRSSSSSQR